MSKLGGERRARRAASGHAFAYPVLLLTAVQVANAADRCALSVLISPIKAELRLTDGQAGLLLGMAFAAAYAFLALPLGRLADRGHRIRLLSACLTLWSTCTLAFGFASSLVHLVLARVGVAGGESGAYATTQSLVGDYVPATHRGAALGVIQAGNLLGMMAGLAAAGVLSHAYGWRTAFVVLGGLGIPLAILLISTLAEPPRGKVDGLPRDARPTASIWRDLRTLLSMPSYGLALAGMALASMPINGNTAWLPSMLIRKFGLEASGGGLLSALLVPLPMLAGTLAGILWGDRLRQRDARWTLWLPALGFLLSAPATLVGLYASGLPLVMVATAVPFVVAGLYNIPLLSIVLEISGPRLRGLSASLIAFVSILIGQGLGPVMIGLLSDRVGQASGRPGLVDAMAAMTLFLPLGAGVLLLAARRLKADLAAERAPISQEPLP